MRVYTCILCPNGCDIACAENGGGIELAGALCGKGEAYVRQERSDPRRTLSTLVRVEGGERPLVGARITRAIPRDRIGDVMGVARAIRRRAPVARGETLCRDVLGLGCDLIAIDAVAAVR